jgi:hypothetical protein
MLNICTAATSVFQIANPECEQTFVPHAIDITVAAITDTTRAAFRGVSFILTW